MVYQDSLRMCSDLSDRVTNDWMQENHATSNKTTCYTSQLKYVSWLEENVSRAIGQNSMTP